MGKLPILALFDATAKADMKYGRKPTMICFDYPFDKLLSTIRTALQ
jgi:hypothetical protein